MTSYKVQWYLYLYQWIQEVHTYTLVADIVYQAFRIENPRRELQQPPSEDVLQKYLRRTRVNYSYILIFTDAEPPVFSNTPSTQNVNTEFHLATATVWWTPPTISDNSGEAVKLSSNYSPGDNFAIGNTTLTYETVDAYGNTATYSFDIVVTGNFIF